MNLPIRRVMLLAALGSLTGCVSFGPGATQRNYVLQDRGMKNAAPGHTRALTLLVDPTTASSFYNSENIAYSRTAGTRAYYQFSIWAERPSQQITELLFKRMQGSGLFRAVAMSSGGVRGNLLLSSYLDAIYHDAATLPGDATITLTVDLVDIAGRELVARRTFAGSSPPATFDAAGAVEAFNDAITQILDDISAWTDSVVPP
jgi:ABC-type uncharacterized transport system auxiliary subunit